MYFNRLFRTDLINKCGTCKNYKPLIKKSRGMKFDIEYCHGECEITNHYKQRTETCKKYTEVENDK